MKKMVLTDMTITWNAYICTGWIFVLPLSTSRHMQSAYCHRLSWPLIERILRNFFFLLANSQTFYVNFEWIITLQMIPPNKFFVIHPENYSLFLNSVKKSGSFHDVHHVCEHTIDVSTRYAKTCLFALTPTDSYPFVKKKKKRKQHEEKRLRLSFPLSVFHSFTPSFSPTLCIAISLPYSYTTIPL